jgi:hypothetical protein
MVLAVEHKRENAEFAEKNGRFSIKLAATSPHARGRH